MINSQNWVEKYRVKRFSDIRGQDLAVGELKDFLKYFPKEKKAILLVGPAGTGKTSLAYAAKNELNFEMFELNASDFRNKEQLDTKLKPALEQKSLFSNGKIVLVDEIDGLTKTDRGGAPELIRLIEESNFPIVLTANDIWDKKFTDIRKKCKVVSLKEPSYKDIAIVLQEIAKKEKMAIENQILISIAIRCKGDIRAAINDLQILASDEDSIKNYLTLDERNKMQDIFNVMKIIFKQSFNNDILRIYDSVDMPLEKIFLWIEENIPHEYNGKELYDAYEALSLADVFRGRIRNQRYWRFLVYQNLFLSAGISTAKSNPRTGFTHYQRPTRILKIWKSNMENIHKKAIAEKYAAKTHYSIKGTMKEFRIIKMILKNQGVQKEIKMNDKEAEWVAKIN